MGFYGLFFALYILICDRCRDVNIIIIIYTLPIILKICRRISRVPFTRVVIYVYVVQKEGRKVKRENLA